MGEAKKPIKCQWCKKKDADQIVNLQGNWLPTYVCSSCLNETNDRLMMEDEQTWDPMCLECGGSGQYDDVVSCSVCEGEGVLRY